MTQTMRQQLQALVKDIKFIRDMNVMLDRRRILMELESILATPEPETYRCNICGGLVQLDGTKPSIKFGPGGKQ